MNIRLKYAFFGVSLLAISSVSNAQDAAPPSREGVSNAGEIIVTARRREESLQDVPLAVNAVTADAIQKLNIRNYEDVTALVPGYTVANNRTGAGVNSNIRGIDYNSGASGSNTTVEYYINDAVAPSGTVTVALFDVAQIEVLRGPQGTLRGRATPSGSVNITTRRPNLYEVGGYLTGTLNHHGEWNFNGAMNIPLIADKLAFRLAGVVAEDEINRVFAPNSPKPSSSTRALRASLSADPLDGVLLLDFSYTNQHRKQLFYDQVQSARDYDPTLGASSPFISAKDRGAFDGLAYRNRIRYETYNWQAQLNLLGQKLTYVGANTTGYYATSEPLDKAGVYSNPSGVSFSDPATFANYARGRNLCQLGYTRPPLCPPLATGSIVPFEQNQRTDQDTTSHELRLQNVERVAGMFDYVLGAFSYDTNPVIPFMAGGGFGLGGTYAFWNPPPANPADLAITPPSGIRTEPAYLGGVLQLPLYIVQPSREKSIFANVTAHFGPATELSGGVRRIWYNSHFRQFFGTSTGGALASAYDIDDAHTIYSVSAKHDFNSDLMVYASVGSSFRPGNVVVSGFEAFATPEQQEFLNVKPETSTSYEVGFKSDWFDNRLRLNVTAYYQKFKNFQYRLPTRAPFLNTGTNLVDRFNFAASVPVEVKGVEAEIGLTVTDRLQLGGVVSYVDGKIKNGVIACNDKDGDGVPDTDGILPTAAQLGAGGIASCAVTQSASVSPQWSATLTADYSHPVSGSIDAFARGLYSWRGNTAGDPTNSFDSVKAFGLLNLFLGLRNTDSSWEVSLFAKNVTNTLRVLTRSDGILTTAGAPASVRTNYFGITTTAPREFGLNLRYAFGSR